MAQSSSLSRFQVAAKFAAIDSRPGFRGPAPPPARAWRSCPGNCPRHGRITLAPPARMEGDDAAARSRSASTCSNGASRGCRPAADSVLVKLSCGFTASRKLSIANWPLVRPPAIDRRNAATPAPGGHRIDGKGGDPLLRQYVIGGVQHDLARGLAGGGGPWIGSQNLQAMAWYSDTARLTRRTSSFARLAKSYLCALYRYSV